MITKEIIDNYVEEHYPDEDILIPDGFEEAFVGIAMQFNKAIAIFDKQKCIEILCRDMPYEEAVEYFYYNIEGAYVGERTPAFLDFFKFETNDIPEKHIAEQFELPLNKNN
jgi:hypothetical protein